MAHVADRLQALLSGGLPPVERTEVDAHLAACPVCSEERDLLASAHAMISPLSATEARPGFAARVALHAAGRGPTSFGQWIRWTAGGIAAAGTALAIAALLPAPLGHQRADDLRIAQRLDLFEDFAVVEHREALEELEVVSVLHTLEARP
jgi:anti-sigma factor RsiW